jgi:hypothetical protein
VRGVLLQELLSEQAHVARAADDGDALAGGVVLRTCHRLVVRAVRPACMQGASPHAHRATAARPAPSSLRSVSMGSMVAAGRFCMRSVQSARMRSSIQSVLCAGAPHTAAACLLCSQSIVSTQMREDRCARTHARWGECGSVEHGPRCGSRDVERRIPPHGLWQGTHRTKAPWPFTAKCVVLAAGVYTTPRTGDWPWRSAMFTVKCGTRLMNSLVPSSGSTTQQY